jgi:mRNA interferase MazF
MVIKQYEVFWINLDPTIGHEVKKTRPCVIISPDEMNHHIETVMIAPITSTMKSYPTRVVCIIKAKKGAIMLEQIRTVDKRRLLNKIDKLSVKEIQQVKKVIKEMLVD